MATTAADQPALIQVAWRGNVELVRLLLQQNQADPNETDAAGLTPLVAACDSPHACVDVVRLLLDAGADPTIGVENAVVPLHVVARHGRIEFVDMLYSRAPATLNISTARGGTPLYFACKMGHKAMVSKLLSMGARESNSRADTDTCPLLAAVCHGFVGVVRVLISEGGITVVGGEKALLKALWAAAQYRQATILGLLLTAIGGKEKRSEWANVNSFGERLLHAAAGYGYCAGVSLLLNAGADESALDRRGSTPEDAMILYPQALGRCQMDPLTAVAIRRMLHRGPAYRARSWAWPLDDEVDSGGGRDSDGHTSDAVHPSLPLKSTLPGIGLRNLQPIDQNGRSKLSVSTISRASRVKELQERSKKRHDAPLAWHVSEVLREELTGQCQPIAADESAASMLARVVYRDMLACIVGLQSTSTHRCC